MPRVGHRARVLEGNSLTPSLKGFPISTPKGSRFTVVARKGSYCQPIWFQWREDLDHI